MRIKAVCLDMEALGAQFANMNSSDQLLFLKGMARELHHWPSDHQKEMQAMMVRDKLSEKDKRQLEIFLGCLWWKPEED